MYSSAPAFGVVARALFMRRRIEQLSLIQDRKLGESGEFRNTKDPSRILMEETVGAGSATFQKKGAEQGDN